MDFPPQAVSRCLSATHRWELWFGFVSLKAALFRFEWQNFDRFPCARAKRVRWTTSWWGVHLSLWTFLDRNESMLNSSSAYHRKGLMLWQTQFCRSSFHHQRRVVLEGLLLEWLMMSRFTSILCDRNSLNPRVERRHVGSDATNSPREERHWSSCNIEIEMCCFFCGNFLVNLNQRRCIRVSQLWTHRSPMKQHNQFLDRQGQDVVPISWRIGVLRLRSSQAGVSFNFLSSDGIKCSKWLFVKFDCVFVCDTRSFC